MSSNPRRDFSSDFPQRARALYQDKRLTVDMIAARLGVARSTVYLWAKRAGARSRRQSPSVVRDPADQATMNRLYAERAYVERTAPWANPDYALTGIPHPSRSALAQLRAAQDQRHPAPRISLAPCASRAINLT